MKLSQLIKDLEIIHLNGPDEFEVEGIAYDSREVQEGWLFVAVSGHQVDGAEYITEAVSRGACAVISENDLDLGRQTTHIQVACARRALAALAIVFFGNPSRDMYVIGVTGTNGKTTTTYMIRDLLQKSGRQAGLLGTVAYVVGTRSIPASRTTPEAMDIHKMFCNMRDVGCDSVVLEVSSHAIALERIHGIDFDVCVFTNLTQDHLDYHKDMDSYYAVKAQLFKQGETHDGHTVVINVDDPWGRKLASEPFLRNMLVTYGEDAGAMVRASNIVVSAEGTQFDVETPWGKAGLSMQLLGRFNVHNALAALAVGGVGGIPLEEMVEVLVSMPQVPGRLEPVGNGKGRKVFVDYAHTDDALKNVLDTLREICAGRLIVVFGCGGNRDQGKRRLMGAVADAYADYSIVTSDNPRNEEPARIAVDIVRGFAEDGCFEVELDRKLAIARGIELMESDDILLIAGKGHETYQEFKGTVIPFDDREIAQEILG